MRNLVLAKIKEIAPQAFSYSADALVFDVFEQWCEPFINEREAAWDIISFPERKAKIKEIADRQTESFCHMVDNLSDEVLLRTLVALVDFNAFAVYH